MSIKDQRIGGSANSAQGQQGRPRRPQGATGLAGGSTMFSRMPAYTPVTRAPAPDPYAAQTPSHQDDQNGYGYAGGQEPYGQQGYAGGYDQPYDAGQGYQQPYQNGGYQQDASVEQDEPLDLGAEDGQSYEAGHSGVEQSFESYGEQGGYNGGHYGAHPYAEDEFAAGDYAPQNGNGYGGYEPHNGQAPHGQGYEDQGYTGQEFGSQGYSEQGYGEQGYGERGYVAESYAGADYTNQNYNGQDYGGQAYGEAGYDEQGYAGEHGDQAYADANDPHRAVQPFEAHYDHAPEIALGHLQQPQAQYGEHHDADFFDDAQAVPPPEAAKGGKLRSVLGGRSMFMVASALLGAVALGGALAFAYKQSGGELAEGEPPLITAENTPVKEAPEAPGGKEFPHKNKLIYDRLENGDQPEEDRLVPRQEELALPNMPAATDMPDLAAATGAPTSPEMPAAEDESGPRKVKTLVVRPDGSVDTGGALETADASGTAPATGAPAPEAPTAPVTEPTTTAAIPPTEAAPAPAPAPSVNRKYVVQVASKQDQKDALGSFADLQQKYPTLLANYRPIVQRVDLGAKGVWYRLQIGPMDDQGSASQLCTQLKSNGLNDCLVMAQ